MTLAELNTYQHETTNGPLTLTVPPGEVTFGYPPVDGTEAPESAGATAKVIIGGTYYVVPIDWLSVPA